MGFSEEGQVLAYRLKRIQHLKRKLALGTFFKNNYSEQNHTLYVHIYSRRTSLSSDFRRVPYIHLPTPATMEW